MGAKTKRIAMEVLLVVTCLAVLVAAIVFIVLALSRPSHAAELVLGPLPKAPLKVEAAVVAAPVTPPEPSPRPVVRVLAAIKTPVPTRAPVVAPVPAGSTLALGQRMAAARGWTGAEWQALRELWDHESGWDPNNYGPWVNGARACGIPQRYPCSGLDAWSPSAQIQWGLDYIAGRYGSPSVAWGGWYGRGRSY